MKKTVDSMLRNHKENIALYNALLLELEHLDEETIEGLCIPAVVLTDMPRSVTNRINNPTANVTIHYMEQTKVIRQTLLSVGKQIDMVENALKALRNRQLWLIKARYFENLSWTEIRIEYCKVFPQVTQKLDGKIEVNSRPYANVRSLMNNFMAAKKRMRKIILLEGIKRPRGDTK